jgi:hypothetical protein
VDGMIKKVKDVQILDEASESPEAVKPYEKVRGGSFGLTSLNRVLR